MLPLITVRNVGAAAIVAGLFIAVVAPGGASGRGLVIAALLAFVGVGLRIEAAVRATAVRRSEEAQLYADPESVSRRSLPAE